MAAPTNQELLDSLNTAIKAFLDGGAVVQYAIGDRSLQRADLSDLLELRDALLAGIVPIGGFRTYVSFQEASAGPSRGLLG